MNLVPAALTRATSTLVLKTKANSPTILFGVGVVGVVATAVMASKATLKLEEVTEKHKESLETATTLREKGRDDYTEEDYSKDLVYIYARSANDVFRLYGPTLVVGAISIACLAGSHHILTKRNAALTIAYKTIDEAFKQYRARVLEDQGPEKDREYRFGVSDTPRIEAKKGKKTKEVEPVGLGGLSGYARFFDESCSSWSKTPEYNQVFLQAQQNYFNDRLRYKGHVFLNEVYDALGMERSPAGAVVGWIWEGDGDNYIDFGIWDHKERAEAFRNGYERSVLLDFNVDGVIYKHI